MFARAASAGRYFMKQIDSDTPVGFVGVGAMGSRIVRRLLANGYKVNVYNRDRAKAEKLIADGAVVFDSLASLATKTKVIMSCLTDDSAVCQLYLAPAGILANAAPDTIVVEMSTVRPDTSRELAQKGADRGIKVIDVAISGSTSVLEQGMVTLLGGGDTEVFAAVEPVFKIIAKQYFLLGPAGSGTAAKLVVNALLGVGMQAVAEACVLGEKQGLDRTQLLTVLSKTAVVAPAHVGKLLRAIREDYGAQFALRLMNKDFRLILQTASKLSLTLPVTEAAFQINSQAFALGPEQDYSIVIREMESRTQQKAAKEAVSHQV